MMGEQGRKDPVLMWAATLQLAECPDGTKYLRKYEFPSSFSQSWDTLLLNLDVRTPVLWFSDSRIHTHRSPGFLVVGLRPS
jgi:hypothetical protein